MFDLAYAMGQGGGTSNQGAPGGMMIPIIMMIGIFYFLLWRPEQKKRKEHTEMLNSLKKGDHIISNAGIHGHITNLDEKTITLEIAERVRIKIDRGYVASLKQAVKSDKDPKNTKKLKSK